MRVGHRMISRCALAVGLAFVAATVAQAASIDIGIQPVGGNGGVGTNARLDEQFGNFQENPDGTISWSGTWASNDG